MGGGGSHNTIAIYCNILYQAIMIDDSSSSSSSRGAARKNQLLQFREFSYDNSHVGQIQCHQRKSVVRFSKKKFLTVFLSVRKNWILLYKNLTEKCSWTHHNVPKKIKSAQTNHQQYLFTYSHCRIPHNRSNHTLPLHF